MAISNADADAYIGANCLDVEDWQGSEAERKTRLLNVSSRTLAKRFPQYVIPDNAVYEFANVLSVKFNDTNKYAQNGIKGVSVAGISFSFGDILEARDPAILITQPVADLIGDANGGVRIRYRRIGQGVK